jgi:hypothetical protein
MGMYYSRMNDFLLSPAGAAVMMSAVLFGLGLISVFWSRRRREYRRSNENDLERRLADYLKGFPAGDGAPPSPQGGKTDTSADFTVASVEASKR